MNRNHGYNTSNSLYCEGEKKRNLDKGLINDLYVCGALRNQEHLCLMGCFGVVEYEC